MVWKIFLVSRTKLLKDIYRIIVSYVKPLALFVVMAWKTATSMFIQNVKETQMGLEQHEGEYIMTDF